MADTITNQKPALEHLKPVSGQRWQNALDETGEKKAERLALTTGLPLVIARLLTHRGVGAEDVDAYLEPRLRDLMPDPHVLQDMEKGAARIAKAIRDAEEITVFGDFDVDGATSVALVVRYLAACGLKPRFYIPDRLTEGYGPNEEAMRQIRSEGASLCIMLDCGTLGHGALNAAQEAGLDVVVIDHHQAGETLPPAVAIINPNREDDISGLGHLCAVAVGFLTLVAVNRALREEGFFADRPEPDLLALVDLVALGTVCDVVPLTGLNRAFVRLGLKVMASGSNPGLRALRDVARADGPPNPYHLGFLLGPRINAGGRIGEADMGARLLMSHDEGKIDLLARELDTLNAQRQAIEADMLAEAMQKAPEETNEPFVLAAGEGWHPGIVGLVAARLKERFSLPAFAIAFHEADAPGSGSARSIPGVDLGRVVRDAVEKGLLLKGGGHAMAAGFKIEKGAVADFSAYLAEQLSAMVASADALTARVVEGEISAGAATVDLLDRLEAVGPYGAGNQEPLFLLPAHRISGVKLAGTSHVSFYAQDAQNRSIRGIAFRAYERPLGQFLLEKNGGYAHLLGTLKPNYWQGKTTVSLHLVDASSC